MMLHTYFQAHVFKDVCQTEECGVFRAESNGDGRKREKFKAKTDTALTRDDELAGC